MPQVVNGCGTWYYGKQHIQEYQGTCRACGRAAVLTSYDTRLYVVVVFIPIIPLGRKRIIEECGACRRHFVVPLNDYRRAEDRVRTTIEDYRQKPGDLDAMQDVLQASVGIRNMQSFLHVAPELEKGMSGNARGLCILASAHDLFARAPEAERLYRAALEVENDDEISELLADTLLRQNRPEDAAPYLQHIIDKSIPDRINLLFHLAQAYQAKGDHEKAVEIFDQCEMINPAIGKEEAFGRLRSASEQRRGTNEALAIGEITSKLESAKKRRKFSKVAGFVVGLSAILYAVWALVLGYQREIYLVNGLSIPYTTEVNGTRYEIPAMGFRAVRTGEGDVTVQMIDMFVPQPPQTVRVSSSFLFRPFSKQVFIVNPDQTAIIRFAKVYYASGDSRIPPQEKFVGGQALIEFDSVDYPFESPPDSIKADSKSGTLSRTTVTNLDAAQFQQSPASILMALTSQLAPNAPSEIARRHVLLEPDQIEFVGLLNQISKPEEISNFLRPLLSIRPLKMQWHRAYQSAQSDLARDEQVEREYAAMLEKEPRSGDLMYLLGRSLHDTDKGVELCKKAVAASPPCTYAYYYLAGHAMEDAQFDQAVEYGQAMVKQAPGQYEFRQLYAQSLIAAQQYPKALEVLNADARLPLPLSAMATTDAIYVYVLSGNPGNVTLALDTLIRRLEMDGLAGTKFKEHHQAYLAYVGKDVSRFEQVLSASDDSGDRFMAALSRGDVAAIEKESQMVAPSVENHLLSFIAVRLAGSRDAADRHLQAARTLLAKGDFVDRAYAAALGGSPTMPAAYFIRLWRGHRVKPIYLAAMALVDAPNRDSYVTIGRKLNFDRRFPHLLIEQAFVQATGPTR